MLFAAYSERLIFQLDEAISTSSVTGRVDWLLIKGTDGTQLGQGSYAVAMGDANPAVVVPFSDNATEVADPLRMKKVSNVMLNNQDDIAHTFLVFYDSGSLSLMWRATIPAGGSVSYNPIGGWVVYREDGSPTFSGVNGTNGADGADGADGWTVVAGPTTNFASTSTTPSDVTDMAFSALADTTYEVHIIGIFQSAATTTGVGMSLSTPAAAQATGFIIHPTSANANGSSQQTSGGNPTGTTTGVAAANTNTPFTGNYLVVIGNTAGTVQLRLRSETTSAVTLIADRVFMKYRVVA